RLVPGLPAARPVLRGELVGQPRPGHPPLDRPDSGVPEHPGPPAADGAGGRQRLGVLAARLNQWPDGPKFTAGGRGGALPHRFSFLAAGPCPPGIPPHGGPLSACPRASVRERPVRPLPPRLLNLYGGFSR